MDEVDQSGVGSGPSPGPPAAAVGEFGTCCPGAFLSQTGSPKDLMLLRMDQCPDVGLIPGSFPQQQADGCSFQVSQDERREAEETEMEDKDSS